MENSKVFDEVLDGPANLHQVEFLEKYIEDNADELQRFPEYLDELRALIGIILQEIEDGKILQFMQ